MPGMRVERVSSLGGDVSNIFPYAEDGTPLHNVRLYDQDGNPIMLEPGFDQELVIPCDGEPPMRNAYPLPLRPVEHRADPAEPEAACVPATPAPTDATASATPSASPSPSPSPSATPSRR